MKVLPHRIRRGMSEDSFRKAVRENFEALNSRVNDLTRLLAALDLLSIEEVEELIGESEAFGDPDFSIEGNFVVQVYNLPWKARRDYTMTKLLATVDTAPVGADLTIDLLINGTSVATVTIADGETEGEEVTDIFITRGDKLKIEVTQVGSTTAGADGTIQPVLQRAA